MDFDKNLFIVGWYIIDNRVARNNDSTPQEKKLYFQLFKVSMPIVSASLTEWFLKLLFLFFINWWNMSVNTWYHWHNSGACQNQGC